MRAFCNIFISVFFVFCLFNTTFANASTEEEWLETIKSTVLEMNEKGKPFHGLICKVKGTSIDKDCYNSANTDVKIPPLDPYFKWGWSPNISSDFHEIANGTMRLEDIFTINNRSDRDKYESWLKQWRELSQPLDFQFEYVEGTGKVSTMQVMEKEYRPEEYYFLCEVIKPEYIYRDARLLAIDDAKHQFSNALTNKLVCFAPTNIQDVDGGLSFNQGSFLIFLEKETNIWASEKRNLYDGDIVLVRGEIWRYWAYSEIFIKRFGGGMGSSSRDEKFVHALQVSESSVNHLFEEFTKFNGYGRTVTKAGAPYTNNPNEGKYEDAAIEYEDNYKLFLIVQTCYEARKSKLEQNINVGEYKSIESGWQKYREQSPLPKNMQEQIEKKYSNTNALKAMKLMYSDTGEETRGTCRGAMTMLSGFVR